MSLSRKALRISSALAIISTLVVNTGTSSSAQEAPTGGTPILVSPAVLNTTLDPGASTTETFQVTNSSTGNVDVTTTTHSLITANNDLPRQYRTKLDSSTWITVTPATFALTPGQTIDVTARFTAPSDAEAGGHYASIIVAPQPQNAPPITGTGAQVFGQVDVSTLTTINGNVNEKLSQVGALKVKHVNTEAPIVFSFALKNTGNVHLFPTNIELDVSNRGGTIVEKLQVPAIKLGRILLPGTTHTYRLVWPDLPHAGSYKAKVIVNYGASNNAKVLTITSSRFWAASVTVIVSFFVVLAIAVIVVISYIVKFRKRRTQRATPKSQPALHDTP